MQHLVDALPPESATKTAIRDRMTSADFERHRGPSGWGPWSHEAQLLAVLSDRVAWLTWTLARANGGKPDDPEPIRRPGVGLSGREQRYRDALTAAHRAYAMSHAGAYPPDGWDAGITLDDFA